MKKTSFYTLPTVMKVSMVCEAAAPEVGGSYSTKREVASLLDLLLLQVQTPPPFFRTCTS